MLWAVALHVVQDTAAIGWTDKVYAFLDTPAPYSPFSEYLLVMFLLWLLARRGRKKPTFEKQAQEVLDERLAKGEISRKTYEKYRQDVSLRPKR
jgi:hypothetical protein